MSFAQVQEVPPSICERHFVIELDSPADSKAIDFLPEIGEEHKFWDGVTRRATSKAVTWQSDGTWKGVVRYDEQQLPETA